MVRQHRRHNPYACLAGFAVLLHASAAAAEQHGRVLFNGLPVPGAVVTATQGSQRLETVTDSQGVYQFAGAGAGAWVVRVETLGFVPVERTVAAAYETPVWELKMQPVAEITAAARFVAPAPAVVVASPGLQPRAGASATAKARGTGDAESAPAVPAAAEPNDAGMVINGSELNAATSKYTIAPAFGSGRPGSKSLYTGSVGANASDSALDARPYSITGLPVPKASYNRFTGVATLGGPLRIPRVLPNGPNFFIGYQWTRNSDAQTLSALMPTLSQRAGDLSGTLSSTGQPVTVADPTTGAVITGAVPVSAQAKALLALYPLPNLAGNARYNYQTQVLSVTHSDSMQVRLDRGFGRRDQVYGTFGFRNVRESQENVFHFLDTRDTLGINTDANWSHRFPHSFLMTAGYEFSRVRRSVRPNFEGVRNVSGDAGITGNDQTVQNWGPPNLGFSSGVAGLNDAQSAFNRNRTDRVSVSTVWTHRKHVVTFGGDFRRQEFNELTQTNPRGSFSFTGAATANAAAKTSGSDFADFLLGTPDTSAVAFGNADKYFRQSVYDGFVTDDWRVRPELTLNVGVRWDYAAPLTELFGRLVNLDLPPGFTTGAAVLGSSPVGSLTGTHLPTSLVRPDKRDVQPRVGLSWRPFPTRSTVVRAGYGIYADTSVYLPGAEQMAQQAPLSKSLSVSRSSACPITLANGFQNCGTTTAQTFAVDPNFRVGYAQTWRVAVQNDLPGAMVLTASYLGTKGSHGLQQFLPNTYPIGVAQSTSPVGFVYQTSNGASIRNAGEVQLRRRLRSGLTATLDYVYAHSIDNDASLGGTGYVSSGASSSDATSLPSRSIAQNWLDLNGERSRSSFDQRHKLSGTVQYTSGQGLHGGALMQGWRGRVLKDWLVAAQMNVGSGLPETPVYFAAVPGTGFTGTIRASRTGSPIYAGANGAHLNAAAYSAPAAGSWGNAGRYSIDGPGTLSLDTSLSRTFRLHDRTSLDVRLDTTNVMNHAVFTAWNSTVNSTTFGLPVGTQPMRSVLMVARLRF